MDNSIPRKSLVICHNKCQLYLDFDKARPSEVILI